MAYPACLPVLIPAWDMTATQAGAIQAAFNGVYAVSLMAASAMADRWGARRMVLASSFGSAAAGLAFAVFADSFASGLLLYCLLATLHGGTYTPTLILVADRFPPARRGAAIGWILAGASLGYVGALATAAAAIALSGYRAAFLALACGSVLSALLMTAALAGTPNRIHPAPARGAGGSLKPLLRNRRLMWLIGGYSAHTWESLGQWAWVPAFLAAAMTAPGSAGLGIAAGVLISAALHLAGCAASFSMGRLSDRIGRRRLLIALGLAGALCSCAYGWADGLPVVVLFALTFVYGFATQGDSPVLATAITEAVEPHLLGRALAIRSLLGFTAGAVAPLAFGWVLDATNPPGAPAAEWGWAFVVLGLGGALAAVAAAMLPKERPAR